MLVCSRCDRHVLGEPKQCPFCGTTLETTRASLTAAATGLVLGLTLFGCGGKESAEDIAGTLTDTLGTESMSSTSTTHGIDDDRGGEEVAYAGPDDWDDDWNDDWDDTTTGEDSTGTDTGTDTDSDTDSVPDTDSDTGSVPDTDSDTGSVPDTDSDTGDAGDDR